VAVVEVEKERDDVELDEEDATTGVNVVDGMVEVGVEVGVVLDEEGVVTTGMDEDADGVDD